MGSIEVPALAEYPRLLALTQQLEEYLAAQFPGFFKDGKRPTLPLKRAKVIHDNLWGTVRFTWQELALLDTPILQRLRDIHQVGLAFLIYPSARHTRFEHTLGVVTIASRIFDALLERNRSIFREIIKNAQPKADIETEILRLKQELRLAALLHDAGHSLFSHVSERVFRQLTTLKDASEELSDFVGKEKGEGEVLSFCLALTPCLQKFLKTVYDRGLIGEESSGDYNEPLDLTNVALLIVGRSQHPHLQFLGDIISSELDADKLDYLIRDAKAAGLPLRYDLDMYLYSARLDVSGMVDENGELRKLYSTLAKTEITGDRVNEAGHPVFDTYRLRLPKKAMHVIEQIVICKLMLFSYMYHHPKVRAAEGLLEQTLQVFVDDLRAKKIPDNEILNRFLDLSDSSVFAPSEILASCSAIRENLFRIKNRLMPREVYRISASEAFAAQKGLVTKFMYNLQLRDVGPATLAKLEARIGECLHEDGLGVSANDALLKCGVWVDRPKTPEFEDTRRLIIASEVPNEGITAGKLFPIGQWQDSYTHYRYYVRIFAFSEFIEQTAKAGRTAMQEIIGVEDPAFYKRIRRYRT